MTWIVAALPSLWIARFNMKALAQLEGRESAAFVQPIDAIRQRHDMSR
jgi:hypothetical protein